MGISTAAYVIVLWNIVSGSTTTTFQAATPTIIYSSSLPSSETNLGMQSSTNVPKHSDSILGPSTTDDSSGSSSFSGLPSSSYSLESVAQSTSSTGIFSLTTRPLSVTEGTVSAILQSSGVSAPISTSDASEISSLGSIPSRVQSSSEFLFTATSRLPDNITTSSELSPDAQNETSIVTLFRPLQTEHMLIPSTLLSFTSDGPSSTRILETSNTTVTYSRSVQTSSVLSTSGTESSFLTVSDTTSDTQFKSTASFDVPEHISSQLISSESVSLTQGSSRSPTIIAPSSSFANSTLQMYVPLSNVSKGNSAIVFTSTMSATPYLSMRDTSETAWSSLPFTSISTEISTTSFVLKSSTEYTTFSTSEVFDLLSSSQSSSLTLDIPTSIFPNIKPNRSTPSIPVSSVVLTIGTDVSATVIEPSLESVYTPSKTEYISPSRLSTGDVYSVYETMSESAATVTVATIPSPHLETFKIAIVFKEVCGRIKTSPQIQMEFLEALISVLTIVSPEVEKAHIRVEKLNCNPLSVGISLTNESREGVIANINGKVKNGSFIVPVIVNGHIVEFTGEQVSLIAPKDKTKPKVEEAAIEESEIIIIAIASFLFMVLLFFGSVLICRECYLRKRAASFNLLDVPHVDLKLTDFTLTRIPRPHMIYFAPGSNRANRPYANGKHSSTCQYGSDVNDSERLSVNAEHLHLRMHDHEEGLVIGVTCTPPRSPTHDSNSSCSSPRSESSDPSKQILLKGGNSHRSRKGTTNPNYTADEDLIDQPEGLIDDDKNQEVIML